MTSATVQREPLAVDAKGAAALIGISDRSWRRMNAGGLTPRPIRLGGAVRWRTDELRQWIEAGAPSRAKWEEMQT